LNVSTVEDESELFITGHSASAFLLFMVTLHVLGTEVGIVPVLPGLAEQALLLVK
jgi:hypothetical protein